MSTLENYKQQILTTFTVAENVQVPSQGFSKATLDNFNKQYSLEACDPIIKQNISSFIGNRFSNGFIYSCFFAYSYHYPLILSPDHVWLAIAQGFAKHIDNNAEELRNKFVDHKGKQTIEIDGDKYGIKTGNPNNDWPSVINEFSDEIDKRIKTNARDLIECNFSTTDKSASIASKVCLMDAMKNYFEYKVCLMCGLPQVTLLGTLQDWENIRNRTQSMGEEYELQWWTDKLLFVLDKFIESAKGNVDKTFWNSICHRSGGGSGPSYLSGWIINFLPYIGKRKNDFTKVETDDIPKGLSIAPFILDDNGHEMKYEFVGGFLGIAQMPETFALMPVIGWGVRPEKEEKKQRF
ncbi:hypothetical protein ABK040_001218 [Willaertia magna]